MCIGFPGQVTAVDDLGATVLTRDRQRRASTLLIPDIAVGDWVYVAAGSIVERLDPAEAHATIDLLLRAAALEEADDEEPAAEERAVSGRRP
jgi:hydrogenase assembly chaperone HypC/HupF